MRMTSNADIHVIDNLSPDESVTRMRDWMSDPANIQNPGLPRPYTFHQYEAQLNGQPGKDWAAPPSGGGHIFLIRSVLNGGYSYGNNFGLRYALPGDYQYFWVLNNDTEVDPQALHFLQQWIESDPAIEMCAPNSSIIHGATWCRPMAAPGFLG